MLKKFGLAFLTLSLMAGPALEAAHAQTAPKTELVGYAMLPADTFADGPASGQLLLRLRLEWPWRIQSDRRAPIQACRTRV